MLEVSLAIFALVFVAGVRISPHLKQTQRAFPVSFVFLPLAGVLTLVVVSNLLWGLDYVPKSDIGGLVKVYREKLTSHTPDKLLIVVDGGSMAARGLDGELVSRRLAERGIENTFIQLTLMGANHTERDFLNKYLLSQLPSDARDSIAKSKIVFLLEIYTGYDRNPLAKAHENAKAQRVIDYLSIGRVKNAYDVITDDHDILIRATRPFIPQEIRRNKNLPSEVKLAVGKVRMELFLLETSISNLFRVGIFSRRGSLSKVRPLNGYRPIKAQRAFDFASTEMVLNIFSNHTEKNDYSNHNLTQKRAAWIRETWQFADTSSILFFSTPTISEPEIKNMSSVCEAVSLRNCIPYNNRSLLESLNDKKYWRDPIHLTSQGAPLFSNWFADELALRISEGDM